MILDEVSADRPERLVRLGADLTYDQFRQLNSAGAASVDPASALRKD
jgi:hypothetical protein